MFLAGTVQKRTIDIKHVTLWLRKDCNTNNNNKIVGKTKARNQFRILYCNIYFQCNIRKWLWFRGQSIKYVRWECGWTKSRVCCFSDVILLLKSFLKWLNELFSAQKLYHVFTKNNKRKRTQPTIKHRNVSFLFVFSLVLYI